MWRLERLQVQRTTRCTVGPQAAPPPQVNRLVLDLVVAATGNRLVVTGELDVATADRLTALLSGLELGRRPLTVDMSGVSFADSHGLQPLVDAMAHRKQQHLTPLRLYGTRPQVARIVALMTSSVAP